MSRHIVLALVSLSLCAQLPHPLPNGYDLPNGWRITPAGRSVPTEDMVLNVSPAPDGKAVVALHSGFNPHGIVVVNPATEEVTQRIGLRSAWLGLAWHPNGKQLFVSGGNANGRTKTFLAPVYVFDYSNGKLSDKPVRELTDKIEPELVLWSGLAHHPSKDILYAANRGTEAMTPGYVAVFDSKTGEVKAKITVEMNPYDLVLTPDGKTLYVSNWASDSVSVIDTASNKVVGTIAVGDNPNDMELSKDGRLFVSCANDNSVVVIDTKTRVPVERISTALTPRSPEGSTPNGITLDRDNGILFVANADNNDIAVVNVKQAGKSEVLGFIPTGWYPSSVTLTGGKTPKLFVGNSKGMGGWSTERGPHSPLAADGRPEGRGSSKSLQKGTIEMISMANLRMDIKAWTKQVYDNVPYKDEYLARAKAPTVESVVPRDVGVGSPIKHVIYIIRENRTYDQVLGDMKKGNGDPRITIFGEKVTPNGHKIADQFVLFDNLYCDGEVSVDGHSWSNSAYATDFNEKLWPITYGGHSKATPSLAHVPGAGAMWDLARKKGLTYRSYGEYTTRESDKTRMEAIPAAAGLMGHVAPKFKLPGMRDTDNVRAFVDELEQFEKNYDSTDPNKRLPNYVVMSLPEDHTRGTRPGDLTPRAMVANNDYAVGMLVDRVTHSKYWPETAIFIIEDDAQDGSDHVDARRTVGLVISPYIRRGKVDSTLYSTSSFLRTMQLLLGLPPMSQYDAAATPLYAAFDTKPDMTPYTHVKPQWDVNEKNLKTAWGAKKSMKMDLDEVDEAPMFDLNEIIWKSVMGANSPMPPPVHRAFFHPQSSRAAE